MFSTNTAADLPSDRASLFMTDPQKITQQKDAHIRVLAASDGVPSVPGCGKGARDYHFHVGEPLSG